MPTTSPRLKTPSTLKFSAFLALFALVLAGGTTAHAQVRGGEIQDAQIIIEKNRNNVMPELDREYENAPSETRQVQAQEKPIVLKEAFLKQKLDIKPKLIQIRPGELEKPNHLLAKAGIGNYFTTNLELYFSKVNKNIKYNAGLYHLNSANGPVKYSGSGNNALWGGLSYSTKSSQIGGEVRYELDRYRLYARRSNEVQRGGDILTQYKTIAGSVFLKSYGKALAEIQADVHRTGTSYPGMSEVGVNAFGKLYGKVNKAVMIGADYKVGYNSLASAAGDLGRGYVLLEPQVAYRKDKLTLAGGLGLAVSKDSTAKTNVYPILKAEYLVLDSLKVFAGLGGGLDVVNLYNTKDINPYLNDSLLYFKNNIRSFGANLGVSARVGSVSGKLNGFVNRQQAVQGFVNSVGDTNSFHPVYNAAWVQGLSADLAFRTRNFEIGYSATFRNYAMDSLNAPYSMPRFTDYLYARFTIQERLVITPSLINYSGNTALNERTGKKYTLKGLNDLSLNVQYAFNNSFTVFVNGSNLLNQKRERFYLYQNRGVMVMGGLIWKI